MQNGQFPADTPYNSLGATGGFLFPHPVIINKVATNRKKTLIFLIFPSRIKCSPLFFLTIFLPWNTNVQILFPFALRPLDLFSHTWTGRSTVNIFPGN